MGATRVQRSGVPVSYSQRSPTRRARVLNCEPSHHAYTFSAGIHRHPGGGGGTEGGSVSELGSRPLAMESSVSQPGTAGQGRRSPCPPSGSQVKCCGRPDCPF